MMQHVHGGDIYSLREEYMGEILDFSANINPLGMPEGVRRAAELAIKESACYPDPFCRALTRALAQKEGVTSSQILCGNGAADIIFRVAAAKHPKRAVLLAPCFDEYEAALRMVGCRIAFETLTEQNGFAPTEHILRLLVPGVDVLFLGDPNNPTGKTIDKPLFDAIVRRCGEAGIFLVLDRSFEDFLEHGPPKAPASPGIFVIKAFTKFYAMAGLRLGYGVCRDEALLEAMRLNAQPWSVSTPAQAAGLAALSESGFAEETREVVRKERAFLRDGLTSRGFTVYGSEVNYIFFKAQCTDIAERLRRRGILIRSCGNFRGLDARFFRIAVRTREENERLLAALSRAAGEV